MAGLFMEFVFHNRKYSATTPEITIFVFWVKSPTTPAVETGRHKKQQTVVEELFLLFIGLRGG
jgi:hypothetical protein